MLEDVFAKSLQRLFDDVALPPRDKYRDQLVTALSDLAPYGLEFKLDVHLCKGRLPRLCVEPIALDQRSVDVA